MPAAMQRRCGKEAQKEKADPNHQATKRRHIEDHCMLHAYMHAKKKVPPGASFLAESMEVWRLDLHSVPYQDN